MKNALIEIKERVKCGLDTHYVTKLKLSAFVRKSRFLYKGAIGKEILVTCVVKIAGIINLIGNERITIQGKTYSITAIKQNNLVAGTILYLTECV